MKSRYLYLLVVKFKKTLVVTARKMQNQLRSN